MSGPAPLMENLVSTLRGITRANGFAAEARHVTIGPMRPGALGATPALSVQLMREVVEPLPARSRRRVLRVLVIAAVRDRDATEAGRRLSSLLDDVERAITSDPTQGGLAVSTTPIERNADASPGETGFRGSVVFEIVRHERG